MNLFFGIVFNIVIWSVVLILDYKELKRLNGMK